jgi:hypothetical protein
MQAIRLQPDLTIEVIQGRAANEGGVSRSLSWGDDNALLIGRRGDALGCIVLQGAEDLAQAGIRAICVFEDDTLPPDFRENR